MNKPVVTVIAQVILDEYKDNQDNRRFDIRLDFTNSDWIVIRAVRPESMRCVRGWRVVTENNVVYVVSHSHSVENPQLLVCGHLNQLAYPNDLPEVDTFNL
jgi:hypothetical protein